VKGLIFTYLLTYGGAVASLFDPFIGLLIYFCFAIIKPEAMWHWSVPAGNYSRIIAIALLAGWALQGFGNWKFRGAKPVLYSLLGFYGWAGLSALFAPDSQLAWSFMESLGKIVLPFVVGATLIDSVARLKQVAWVLMLSQAYVALELNLSYYQGFNRLMLGGFAGMDNNYVSITMVAGAGLAFFLGLGEKVVWRRWLAFAAAALMAHVPMIGMSRGGMLGLIVTGVVAFILIPKTRGNLSIFALATAVGLSLAGPPVVERFSSVFVKEEERDVSSANRLLFWGYCWEMMEEEPLFGVGPNQFRKAATLRHPESASTRTGLVQEAHNLWLQTGAELGFPGMAFLVGFYGLTVWRLWKLCRRPAADLNPWLLDASRMVIAALVGFAVSASFVTIEGIELPYYITLIGAGVLSLARPASVQQPAPFGPPARSPAIVGPVVAARPSPWIEAISLRRAFAPGLQ